MSGGSGGTTIGRGGRRGELEFDRCEFRVRSGATAGGRGAPAAGRLDKPRGRRPPGIAGDSIRVA